MPRFDHVLLLGFGAPDNLADIDCFLKIVSEGRNIPQERLAEVRHHYELIGGGSPYNQGVFELAAALESKLQESGLSSVPVFSGMRNWHPYMSETLEVIGKRNLKSGLAVILSPFRSPASCARYKKSLTEALSASSAAVSYEYLEAWGEKEEFAAAQADCVRAGIEKIPAAKDAPLHVLFSAHSIPVSMNKDCSLCDYQAGHERLSSAVADALNLRSWSVCYQSRSGSSREAWLEPDIKDAMAAARSKGAEHILVVPCGFVIDNAEVLYDLDIETREEALKLGLHMHRVRVMGGQDRFLNFLSNQIADNFKR